jgi:hypothetical protein
LDDNCRLPDDIIIYINENKNETILIINKSTTLVLSDMNFIINKINEPNDIYILYRNTDNGTNLYNNNKELIQNLSLSNPAKAVRDLIKSNETNISINYCILSSDKWANKIELLQNNLQELMNNSDVNSDVNSDRFSIVLDRVYNLKQSTPQLSNICTYFDNNITQVVICLIKNNTCVSSINLVPRLLNDELTIISKTCVEATQNKLNSLLRSVAIIVCNNVFSTIISEAENYLSYKALSKYNIEIIESEADIINKIKKIENEKDIEYNQKIFNDYGGVVIEINVSDNLTKAIEIFHTTYEYVRTKLQSMPY